ncbi:hypothetical protein H7F51_15540 [Novosphingobium flavum]|uniref:Dolichyl-phosphate-mannose-protein mannosyltransferase n=1 Tax=Novosphingobium flavum TaxID=1778672 RepID=A0A7X1FTY6_9SPHN|nr:hypothetical protein [Novosphingobium flavum]MBC2666931.1 hypothetical protein [Novosphingobium flavum]
MTGAFPPFDRFAHWNRVPARILLVLVAGLLLMAALTPLTSGEGVAAPPSLHAAARAPQRERDEDLKLYDDVIARLKHGETYYAVIAEEHRRHRFPLHPGFAVRLPTLAVVEAALPQGALIPLSVILMGAVLMAWWKRLAGEPGGKDLRLIAMAALFFGVSIGTTRYFFVLHELWAGQLLALSFGLHRPAQREGKPGRWIGAWLAAAAALAIREHALPFVLLMAAFALYHRRWKESAAWLALIALFLAAMTAHLHTVAAMVRADDPPSASWLTLRGLTGWLSLEVLSSNLRWLPTALAGPLVLLSLFGWAGWRTAAGAFATLLYLGYGIAFMIAGRPDNFYWGMMVAPAMLIGLAFLPMAARGLVHAAFPVQGLGRLFLKEAR